MLSQIKPAKMKKSILLLLLMPLLTFSQTYNFNSDVVGNVPSNVTVSNGTVQVSAHSTQGNGMEVAAGSALNAIVSMDLFPSSANYSVVWKETYTSVRRSGFLLRGTGSNAITNSPGLKQGYLFQSNTTSGDCRIYRSNASGFTQLATTTALKAPGVDTPRWFKANVDGSTLTLDYSDNGTTFTNVITTTDATYASGTTQYVLGFGQGAGGMYIDDVTFEAGVSPSDISIENISPYQVIQRDALGKADILVEGVYIGTPTSIEARWNGNAAWTPLTLDANGAGTFSGTLLNQPQGQGVLEVRFSNNPLIINSVANVGIGDIYIIAGQSNASGRGLTLNTYTHGSLKATVFGNNDTWAELTDPVDSNSGQVDVVSSDAAVGSPWPLVATSIMASQNVPVAFVPTAKGGSSIQAWQPGANHANASTLYGSMNRRITAVGGNVKAILFFQGEKDANNGTSQANYTTLLNNFINTVDTDFSGLKTMVGQIGHSSYSEDLVRAGQISVLQTNSKAILGPVTYDINLSDEGGDTLHFKSNSDMAEFARRWYKAIEKAFYSGTNGYGPIVDSENILYSVSQNKITVPFTDDTTPVINPASTVTATAFNLKNNGVTIGISSLAIVNNTIELTPATELNILQTITLSYALQDAAVDNAIYDNENLPAENFYNLTVSTNAALGIIKNKFGNKLVIYPNPTNGIFSIDLGNTCKSVKVTIMDLSGKQIQTKNYNNSQLLDLNIESKSAGIYLMAIESGENKAIIKLLKK